MKQQLSRFLMIFMTVVIVVTSTLVPVASAYAIVVEGILILIVAGLLVAAGMEFANIEQAKNTAVYAMESMPNEIMEEIARLSTVTGLLGVTAFQAIEKGLSQFVSLSVLTWEAFKQWVQSFFGLKEISNPETGEVTISDASVTMSKNGNFVTLEQSGISYSLNQMDGWYFVGFPKNFPIDKINEYYQSGYRNIMISASYSIYPNGIYRILTLYFLMFNTQPEFIYENGSSLVVFEGPYYSLSATTSNEWNSFSKILNGVRSNVENTFFANFDFYSESGEKLMSATPIQNILEIDAFSNSYEAYSHEMPMGSESVDIAFPDSLDGLVGKSWNDVLSNYDGFAHAETPTADWDYNASLDRAYDKLRDICADLNIGTYDQLLNLSGQLQAEIDALRQSVAAQGADVIGGVNALNDALLEAGLVINGLLALQQALAESQAVDAGRIAELEQSLAKAKDDIQALTDGKTGEGEGTNPVDPPKEETEPGKINWSILTGIAIFHKFPFSLPSDVYAFVSILAAPPKEPVFEFDIFAGKFGEAGKIRLDFQQFDNIRILARNCILITLIVGLIGATKTYIWSGGN